MFLSCLSILRNLVLRQKLPLVSSPTIVTTPFLLGNEQVMSNLVRRNLDKSLRFLIMLVNKLDRVFNLCVSTFVPTEPSSSNIVSAVTYKFNPSGNKDLIGGIF